MMLHQPIEVAGLEIKNRIVMPPIVVFWADETGFVTDRHVAHYRRRAEGGVGLVVVEATAVMASGRLSDRQLGIWDDRFIAGLRRIVDAVHEAGASIFVQIHHGGLKSPQSVVDTPMAPSDYEDARVRARGLSVSEIEEIREAFIAAAVRAERAGFDGVELHGAHSYLLNQFASPRINLREDRYGGDLSARLTLTNEIIAGVRAAVSRRPFVVSIRMGCNEPGLEEGISIARELEAAGIDMLHVSAGMGGVEDSGASEIEKRIPAGFDLGWIVYGGVEISRAVDIPVIAVNGIRTPDQARKVLASGPSFVAMARALLVDPDWSKKAAAGETPVTCIECRPRCHWFENGEKCPRFDANWLA